MTTEPVIYNIPYNLLSAFRGRRVIVRFYDPALLVANVSQSDFEFLHSVQMLTLGGDITDLASWGIGVPIEIVMHDPADEVGRLYGYTKLLDNHPVTASIPVRRGFAHAVKVAASLGFSVKITVGQPSPTEIAEMFGAFEEFLAQPETAEPIEFFQSTMRAFLNDESVTIWSIQEEDPSRWRFITPYGAEMISPRFTDAVPYKGRILATFIEDFRTNLLSERRECDGCEFFTHCGGYFKWPNKDYLCSGGVKELFARIRSASIELKNDIEIEIYARSREEVPT